MVVLDPAAVAPRLASLGFLARSGLTGLAPGYLLVALRPSPSLCHFDPEVVDYWTTGDQRGQRCRLNLRTSLPLRAEVSWGPVRIVDRLGNANEYLTFGGRLTASLVEDVVVVVLSCDTPLLKAGGHSQEVDLGAETVGAFFGRLLRAIDYVPGFEARVSAAEPIVRYAAFLVEALDRFRSSAGLREAESDLLAALEREERRVRSSNPGPWLDGVELWSKSASPVRASQDRRPEGDTQDRRTRM
jgi:hypothetical protein